MSSIIRRRIAAGVLVLAALVPCVVLLLGRYPMDLDVYRAGGHAVLDGQSLYDVRLHEFGFTYPPFAALLFTGFAVLPLGAATVIVTVISLGCLVVLVLRSAPHARRRPPTVPATAALAALLVCEPVRSTLWNGQIDLVLAALVVADLLAPRRRRGHGVGIGIGIAAAIKLTPAIFVIYLLMRGRRADAARATAAFAAATAWAWLMLPRDSLRYWTHELYAGSGLGEISHTSNQSLLAVALRLSGPTLAYPIWAALVVPTVVVAMRVARRVSMQGNEVLAVAVVGIAGCLVSPVSWTHHWIWCIPLLIGLWTRARTRLARGWTIGLGVLFVGYGLLPRSRTDAWPPSWLLIGNAYVLAAVLTLGVCGLDQRRRRRSVSSLHSPGASAKPELALG